MVYIFFLRNRGSDEMKHIRIYTSFSKLYAHDRLNQTRCQPSKGRRCISDVVLKIEGSMLQTCRYINVHVISTDILRSTWMFMDGMRNQAIKSI